MRHRSTSRKMARAYRAHFQLCNLCSKQLPDWRFANKKRDPCGSWLEPDHKRRKTHYCSQRMVSRDSKSLSRARSRILELRTKQTSHNKSKNRAFKLCSCTFARGPGDCKRPIRSRRSAPPWKTFGFSNTFPHQVKPTGFTLPLFESSFRNIKKKRLI